MNHPAIERNIPSPSVLQQVKSVHMTAICGMGMGSLAGLLKAKGFRVSGSDRDVYPPMSTQLEKLGIAVKEGFDAKRLEGVDLAIIGNAVSRGNVELEWVLERRIPCLSLPEALDRFFLHQTKPIVVTGTHGKTTTAALLAYLLDQAGQGPGFFIGGILANYESSYAPGTKGKPFVVEGDEYDSACFDKRPKFVHYPPDSAILTSIEFDHADIYADLNAVKNAFQGFVESMRKDSLLLACGHDVNIRAVIGGCKAKMSFYGVEHEGERAGKWQWIATDVKEGPEGVQFTLVREGKKMGRYLSPLFGVHNLKNLLGVLGVLAHYGIAPDQAMEGLKGFRGVLRRQQIRGVIGGVRVIDDFAHHPTAVKATLEAIRRGYPEGRLWAIFEPRTATSRRKVFQQPYAESFDAADEILIGAVFKADALPEMERFSAADLVRDLRARGKKARTCATVDEIVALAVGEAKPKDTLAVLSNGGFGGIHEKLLRALKENEHGETKKSGLEK